MQANQILALFSKCIRKLSDHFDRLCMNALEDKVTRKVEDIRMEPTVRSLDEDLQEAAHEIRQRQKRDKDRLMKELGSKALKDFAVKGTEDDWDSALNDVELTSAKKAGAIISVKSNR